MDDLWSLKEIVSRAFRVEAFRGSSEYTTAVQAVAENIVTGLMAQTDTDRRVELLRYLDSLQAIDAQLRLAIDDGSVAQAEIRRIEDGGE